MKDENAFEIEVLLDGKISVKSKGSFSPEQHKNADEFIKMIEELAGGEVETKTLKNNLGKVHQHGNIKHSH